MTTVKNSNIYFFSLTFYFFNIWKWYKKTFEKNSIKWYPQNSSHVLLKGRISYIPWCIASYYFIKLPNARDPITSTETWQLSNGGKRLVLPIKRSVPLLCRSIYDFRYTIPNISQSNQPYDSKGVHANVLRSRSLVGRKVFASVRPVLTSVDKALHGLTNDFHVLVLKYIHTVFIRLTSLGAY